MIKFAIGLLILLLFCALLVSTPEIRLLPVNYMLIATLLVGVSAGVLISIGIVEMRYEVSE